MSDAEAIPTPETPVEETVALPKKKGGIPTWAALLIIVIVLGVIYGVYNNMTSDHVQEFKTVKHNAGGPASPPMPAAKSH